MRSYRLIFVEEEKDQIKNFYFNKSKQNASTMFTPMRHKKCLIYNWSFQGWLLSRIADASVDVEYSIAGKTLFSKTVLDKEKVK